LYVGNEFLHLGDSLIAMTGAFNILLCMSHISSYVQFGLKFVVNYTIKISTIMYKLVDSMGFIWEYIKEHYWENNVKA
jgi:hypothetical protein